MSALSPDAMLPEHGDKTGGGLPALTASGKVRVAFGREDIGNSLPRKILHQCGLTDEKPTESTQGPEVSHSRLGHASGEFLYSKCYVWPV